MTLISFGHTLPFHDTPRPSPLGPPASRSITLLTTLALIWLSVSTGYSEILTSLNPATALYNGGPVDDGGTGGSQSGVPALNDAEHPNGFTLNLNFTPLASDLSGTVLLGELGGTTRGFGWYLIDGVPTFVMKQESSDSITPTLPLPDTTLSATAVQSSSGAVTAGTNFSVLATWNHQGTLELRLKPSGGVILTNTFAIIGTPDNWSGNDTLSIRTFSNFGSVGGLSGNGTLVSPPWDVNDLKNFAGTISSAQLWNATDLPGAAPDTNLVVTFTATPGFVSRTNTAAEITLTWSATNIPGGATYFISADQPGINYAPPAAQSGTLTSPADNGSITATVSGALGDALFTLTISNGLNVLASRTASVLQTRPNIIVVLVDDMGYSDLGCYGGEIETPVIDGLATNGLRFTHCYNAARCSPTRAAILTGQYPQSVFVNPAQSLSDLRSDNNVTLAELLGSHGYNTYAVGKWHLGAISARLPEARGFQHFWGFNDNYAGGDPTYAKDMWEEFQYRLYSTSNQVPARIYAPGTFYQTDAIGDYATDFIRHSLTNVSPFFMYVAFGAPHFPIQAPLALIDKYVPTYTPGWEVIRSNRFDKMQALGLLTQPPWLLSPASDSPPWLTAGVDPIPVWNTMTTDRRADSVRKMAAYAAMIDKVDSNIGKIRSLLQQSNQLDNTIIFFVSDNGGDHEGGVYGSNGQGANTPPLTGSALLNMGQPGEPDTYLGAGWANVNNTPYTYYKRNGHEGGIASPLIVHWPECIIRTGQFERSPGQVIDIMPTVLEVTGFTYPSNFNGHAVITPEPFSQSLLAHFTNNTSVTRTVAGEHESNRWYREGNWKLVTKNFSDSRNVANALELYNLSSDPVELNDLSSSLPAKVNELATNWNAWAARVGVPSDRFITIVTPQPQFDPAPLPNDLFVDIFNRPDSADHDASANGMSGALVPPLGSGTAYYDSWDEGSGGGFTEIAGLGLRMAVSSAGMSETALQYNLTNQAILDAGGFSVQFRLDEINGATTDIQNRYAGLGVGLSPVEAQSSGDVNGTTPPFSFRGTAGNPVGTADFFLELDMAGNVKAWTNGVLIATIPVAQTNGVLLACFACNSFAAGATVTVTAFLDGELVDLDPGTTKVTQTFAWDASQQNYIGLSARASGFVALDNLAIRTLPLSAGAATDYALGFGLSGTNSAPDRDPDGDGDDNFTEWLRAGDPTLADADMRLLSVASPAPGEFRLNHYQLLNADKLGLAYSFKYTASLAGSSPIWTNFTPELISSTPVGTTHELRLVRVPLGLVASNRELFIRLEVTQR